MPARIGRRRYCLCFEDVSFGSETERDVAVWSSSADFSSFESSSGFDGHFEDTDGGIERATREELLEIDFERIWIVHHRAKAGWHRYQALAESSQLKLYSHSLCMDLLLDKLGQARNDINVHTKSFSSDRFQDVIKVWFLHKGHADGLNVWECRHEFESVYSRYCLARFIANKR